MELDIDLCICIIRIYGNSRLDICFFIDCKWKRGTYENCASNLYSDEAPHEVDFCASSAWNFDGSGARPPPHSPEGYLNVLKVEIPPGDSIVLQSRDQVTVAIGEQLVTLGIPSKLDIHQKNQDARLSLLLGRHVRSARAGGDTSYHTLTVEALPPDRFSEWLLGRHPGPAAACPMISFGLPWGAYPASSGTTARPKLGLSGSRLTRDEGQFRRRFCWNRGPRPRHPVT